jgi:hypothetical protein
LEAVAKVGPRFKNKRGRDEDIVRCGWSRARRAALGLFKAVLRREDMVRGEVRNALSVTSASTGFLGFLT